MKQSEIHYRHINNQIIGSIVMKRFLVSGSVFLNHVFSSPPTTKQDPSLEKPHCPILGVPFTLKYTGMALLESAVHVRGLKERPCPPRSSWTWLYLYSNQFFKFVYSSNLIMANPECIYTLSNFEPHCGFYLHVAKIINTLRTW